MSIPATKPRDPDKLRVFISFSRRNLEFARKLVRALEQRGIDVNIDERDLPIAVEFQAELLDLIRGADAVVFLVSATSVTSQWCKWELDQVAALSKRLAPALVEAVPDAQIPEGVRKIHFANLTNPETFESEVDRLASALKTDIKWVKAHTRWAERARRWDEMARGGSALLRGAELEGAERWLRDRPREAPDPTAQHIEFITASRLGATRRQRTWVAGSSVVAAVAIALASYAFVQRGIARDRAIVAQKRLVQLMVDHGKRNIGDGNLPGARRWFAEALVNDINAEPADQDAHRLRIAGTRAQLPELAFNEAAGPRGALARFSPNGALLLIAAADGGTIKTIDVAGGKSRISDGSQTASHRCWLTQVAYLHDQSDRIVLAKECSEEARKWIEVDIRDFVSTAPAVTRTLPPGDISLSADGSRALLIPAAKDTETLRAATVYDVPSWQPLGQLTVSDPRTAGTLSRDGRIAAIMDGRRVSVHAVDGASDPRLLTEFNLAEREHWSPPALSPNGRFAVARSGKRFLKFRTDGSQPQLSPTSTDDIVDVAFSPDSCRFSVSFERADRSRRSEIWNACETERNNPETVVEHETALEQWHRALARGGAAAAATFAGASLRNPFQRAAIFGPDGETLATVSAQYHSFRLWRRVDGLAMTPALSLYGNGDPLVDISPDGRAIAATDRSGRTRIWRLDTIASPSELKPVRNRIDSLFFTPDGRHLIAAFFEGGKAVWRVNGSRHAETEFATYSNDTSAVAYDAKNHRLITGGFGQAAFVWDIAAGALASPVIKMTSRITALRVDAQGKRLVVETEVKKERAAQLFELPSGQPLSSSKSIGDGRVIDLDATGTKALARRDDKIDLLDTSDWSVIGSTSQCAGTHVRFSADGRSILCFGPTSFRSLLAENGSDLAPPVTNASAMNKAVLAVSDDGTRALMRGLSDSSAQVVDTRTGKSISPPLEHPASIRTFGFASAGKLVYTSTARSVFLWSSDTGDPISPPLRHDNDVDHIAIDPSGTRLAVSLSEFGSYASASRSALILWQISRATGSPEALQLSAEVNSGLRIEGLGGAIPLQPEQFDASWNSWGTLPREAVGTGSNWRVGRLEQSKTDFARDFHVQWARREKLTDGEFDLAAIKLNPKLSDAQKAALLESAVSAGISSWSVYFDLGKIYASLERWSEAVTNFRKALNLRRDEPAVWLRLAEALFRTGPQPEQNKFCIEMYQYFFTYQPHDEGWNVTAGSCSLYRGKIDVRAKLLEAARNKGLDKSANRAIDALIYSVLLYRENGIQAIASRLNIGDKFVATHLLKALYLQDTGQTVDAQKTVNDILGGVERRRTDAITTALLKDIEDAGLRVRLLDTGQK